MTTTPCAGSKIKEGAATRHISLKNIKQSDRSTPTAINISHSKR